MVKNVKKIAGGILVFVVLAVATYVTFWDPEFRGLELDSAKKKSTVTDLLPSVPREMQSLRALYRTINLVQKHYIDASRIDARVMFVAALKAIQLDIANVIVREEAQKLVMRINDEERQFNLADLKTPWGLLQRMKDVFRFLERYAKMESIDIVETEYSAINGMLKTLDPHSVFLTPEIYRDMRDKTRGKFGGLGIVISIRNGGLTVISPIDGTPAALAGLTAGDKITKIDDVSTVSMALNDAVTLLRGAPGTAVTVEVTRAGWAEPHTFKIVRAIIEVRSVESELLSNRIGYIRIKDFQGNTAKDLDTHLSDLERQGIRGLVLDLRNNPGGLLDAAIRVSDRFLKSGVIVTTAGQGPSERDVRRARDDNREPDYPLVLLVNAGSASASEIVAGALKNHDRALLVGQRTFGKGSVQVLYERGFASNSALKLTTAQYLTPGDVSIQSVGVVPHLELLPMRADENILDLVVQAGYRESDLDHHFEGNRRSDGAQQSVTKLSYLRTTPAPMPLAAGGDAEDGANPDAGAPPIQLDENRPFEPDFEIKMARDLALKMAQLKHNRVDPTALTPLIDQKRDKQEVALSKALKRLGIDWEHGSDERQVNTSVLSRLDQEGPLVPGTEHEVEVAVTNQGPGVLYQLHAVTRCDFRPLDERELAFGRVDPGATITRKLKFKVPKDSLSRVDDVQFKFTEANQREIDSTALRFEVQALPRPRFAYGYQVVDVKGGNGDGLLQPGESVELIVDIENAGEGPALQNYATLKSLSGKELFMIRGRESFGKLEPSKRQQVAFSFDIKPEFAEPEAKLELGLADVDLRVFAVEKIRLPISEPLNVQSVTSNVAAKKPNARVLESPTPNGRVVANFSGRAMVDAQSGEYYRIRFADERLGWVAKADTQPAEIEDEFALSALLNSPPQLIIDDPERVVRADTVRLRGKIIDEYKVRDVYIFVDDEKVFFKSNLNSKTPNELSFEVDVPLKNGMNYIMVAADETLELDAREIIAIRRDRQDGIAFFTSKLPHGNAEPLDIPKSMQTAPRR